MRSSLRIHKRSAGEILAQLGPVVIRVVGCAKTPLARVPELYGFVDQVLSEYPIVAMLIVVEHGAPVPDEDVRRSIDVQLQARADKLVVGYALLGLGFWAERARAFADHRIRLEGCTILVDISLSALIQRLALEFVGIDPDQLTQVVEQLRTQVA
ncbi:hypothetical protein DB30_00730 [Enhygromyxa salina]|uniref:Uncharacterized protein n=1 Tax=Enhygromyxa salina TaxID=215803 RepID=A0A0C2DA78_9BACT|nr:hypothetical protein [Enhygromyxa salina]KIG18445.1 hypothetical protein DB30_00730 [Enhygromyxa salina]